MALQEELDAAVERRTLTLVQGLPRVGRSQLITDWMNRRSDVTFCTSSAIATDEDGVVVIDPLDCGDVGDVIGAVRATARAGGQTRYVVAPTDLAASFELRDKLAGGFETIDVTPLRLNELENGIASLPVATGPLAANTDIETSERHITTDHHHRHWLRGGFPESVDAFSDEASLMWRSDLIAPLLERDYSRFGLPVAYPLQDFLRWLAYRNGSETDETINKFGNRQERKSAVFTLEKLGLIRRLPNFAAVDHPDVPLADKLFLRDTGILHALLGICTFDQLEAHSAIGASFESYAIEALTAAAGRASDAYFYRFDLGQGFEEIDLILDFPAQAGRRIAIECKVGPKRKAEPGFFRACNVLGVDEKLVVHSGPASYHDDGVHRLDLRSAINLVGSIGTVT